MTEWVNSDLIRMARELDEQERAIADDEPNATARQVRLTKASAYLRLAFAELLHLQDLPGLCASPFGAITLSSGRPVRCSQPSGHTGPHTSNKALGAEW